MLKNGTQAIGGKQRGAKVVTGSTSVVRLGKDHRQHVTKHATRGNK